MGKKDIRRFVFQKRKNTEDEEIYRQSRILCEKIIGMPVFRKTDCIYVYMDYKKEASTRELLDAAWKLGKRVAAPKVFGEEMRYFYIHSYEDVSPGYFGIPEPTPGLEEALEETALLIVPGVAFDRNCHRCGYGKGFYDRYLRAHPMHPTIGMALDFQIMDEVPCEEFDICPQLVVTPDALYYADIGNQEENKSLFEAANRAAEGRNV